MGEAVRFLGEFLIFSGGRGLGMRGNSRWRKAVTCVPESQEGLGPSRRPCSPVDIGPEVRAQHVHRLDAAPVLQPHGPLLLHLPPAAGPRSSSSGRRGAPAAGEPAGIARGAAGPAAYIPPVGGASRGKVGAWPRLGAGPAARAPPASPGARNPGEVSGCQFPPFHACFAPSVRFQWAPGCGRPPFFRAESATAELSEGRGWKRWEPRGSGCPDLAWGPGPVFLKEAFANSREGRREGRRGSQSQEARCKLTSPPPS